jgi:hypothetical protein
MKVAPLIVGGLIGGFVWVLALRATHAATVDAKQPGDAPPPSDNPIRGPGGVNTGETPPIYDPSGGPAPRDGQGEPVSNVQDIAAIAATSGDVVSVAVQAPIGVDGNSGAIEPMKTDPITRTILPDNDHPTGGQGTEQQSPTPSHAVDTPPPSYGDGQASYDAYLKARLGTTNGLTPLQMATYLKEAARVGGLAL